MLDEAARAVGVGVTTDEIDRVVHEATIDRECYPSPLNYYQVCLTPGLIKLFPDLGCRRLQFPKSCCTSVNEVICHGIPDMRPLQDGDIVNIDVTIYHRSYHGDLNETLFVGTPSEKAR